jgi:hypothetical protein
MRLQFFQPFLCSNGENDQPNDRLGSVSGSPKTFSHSLALELTPQSGPKIEAILKSRIRLTVISPYRGGAAQRQAVRPLPSSVVSC